MTNEFNLKIRNYKLILNSVKEKNNLDEIKFEKIDTRSTLALYIDRDFYLTEKGLIDFERAFFEFYREPITSNFIPEIESRYYSLVKKLIHTNDLRFMPPCYNIIITCSFDGVPIETPPDNNHATPPPMYKVSKEPFFEYY